MIAVWNYEEFVELINSYRHAYINKDVDYFERKPININLNRAFLNILSSIRSYLDFMERLLKKRYGSDSNIFKNFKKNTNIEYDGNFSYRFLSHLRHYAQHKGFPIGLISLGQRPSQSNINKPEYFFNIRFVRDELLLDFDWKKLESEIKRLPEHVEVMPHIASFLKSVEKIHITTTKDMFLTLHESAVLVLDNVKRLGDKDGLPVVFDVDDDIKEIKNLKHKPIPFSLSQKIASGKLSELFKDTNEGDD